MGFTFIFYAVLCNLGTVPPPPHRRPTGKRSGGSPGRRSRSGLGASSTNGSSANMRLAQAFVASAQQWGGGGGSPAEVSIHPWLPSVSHPPAYIRQSSSAPPHRYAPQTTPSPYPDAGFYGWGRQLCQSFDVINDNGQWKTSFSVVFRETYQRRMAYLLR